MFKKLIFILIGLCGFAAAQSTTVSVTVTDLTSQAWANGTISYVFQPTPGSSGPFYWNGAAVPAQYLTPTLVQLDSSGSASFTIPASTAITPTGSGWSYTICPNASAQCAQLIIPAAGSTQNISAAVTAVLEALQVNAANLPKAYSDSEVVTIPAQGGTYYNVLGQAIRYFNGSVWANLAGSGVITAVTGTAPVDCTTSGSSVNCGMNTVPIANGGTGQTTQSLAFNALTSIYSASTLAQVQADYTACSTASCYITLSQDITQSSPFVLSTVYGKDMVLDGLNHTINCGAGIGSGVCLTISDLQAFSAHVKLENITFDGTSSVSGATGVVFGSTTFFGFQGSSWDNVKIQNFAATGDTAFVWATVEDSTTNGVWLINDYAGAEFINASNNNVVSGLHIDFDGAGIALAVDSSSISFPGLLIQGSTSQTPVVISGSSVNITFDDGCWFENNGDGTSSTRVITMYPGAGNVILTTQFSGCTFNAGSNGHLGYIFGYHWVSGGTFTPILLTGNTNGGFDFAGEWNPADGFNAGDFVTLNDDTGLAASTSITATGISTPGIIPSNLTVGSVPYAESTDKKLVNSPLYTDGTNVGIGTTNPGAVLHVAQYTAGNKIIVEDTYGGMGKWGLAVGIPTVDDTSFRLRYESGSLDVLTASSSGNVAFTGATSAGAGSTDYSTASSAQEAHCLADGTNCPTNNLVPYASGITLTSATSDSIIITVPTGWSFSGGCVFSPTNLIATAATILPYISWYGSGSSESVTINHAAAVGNGASYHIVCLAAPIP